MKGGKARMNVHCLLYTSDCSLRKRFEVSMLMMLLFIENKNRAPEVEYNQQI